MKSENVVIEVLESKCDHYKPGDKIYIKDALIDMEKTKKVCVMALQSFFPFVFAARKGVTPQQVGFGDKFIVQCPDYCEPVVFEIKRKTSLIGLYLQDVTSILPLYVMIVLL